MKVYTTAQANLKKAEDKLKKAQKEAKAKPMDKDLAAAAKEMAAEVAKLKKEMPKQPAIAHVVSGDGKGMSILVRGNPMVKGDAVPQGLPASAAVRDAQCGRTSRGSTSPMPSPRRTTR